MSNVFGDYYGGGQINLKFQTSGLETYPNYPDVYAAKQINNIKYHIGTDTWENVSKIDQAVATTADVEFNSIKLINQINEFSVDGTLAGNSDDAVPTEKAIKTYVTTAAGATDTFLKLPDTPAAYTNYNALYTVNITTDGVQEVGTKLRLLNSD